MHCAACEDKIQPGAQVWVLTLRDKPDILVCSKKCQQVIEDSLGQRDAFPVWREGTWHDVTVTAKESVFAKTTIVMKEAPPIVQVVINLPHTVKVDDLKQFTGEIVEFSVTRGEFKPKRAKSEAVPRVDFDSKKFTQTLKNEAEKAGFEVGTDPETGVTTLKGTPGMFDDEPGSLKGNEKFPTARARRKAEKAAAKGAN